MEWVFVVLLVLAVPIGIAIWLIARTVHHGSRFEELSRRVGELELELFRLKREPESKSEAKYAPPAERAEILQRLQTSAPVRPFPKDLSRRIARGCS